MQLMQRGYGVVVLCWDRASRESDVPRGAGDERSERRRRGRLRPCRSRDSQTRRQRKNSKHKKDIHGGFRLLSCSGVLEKMTQIADAAGGPLPQTKVCERSYSSSKTSGSIESNMFKWELTGDVLLLCPMSSSLLGSRGIAVVKPDQAKKG